MFPGFCRFSPAPCQPSIGKRSPRHPKVRIDFAAQGVLLANGSGAAHRSAITELIEVRSRKIYTNSLNHASYWMSQFYRQAGSESISEPPIHASLSLKVASEKSLQMKKVRGTTPSIVGGRSGWLRRTAGCTGNEGTPALDICPVYLQWLE